MFNILLGGAAGQGIETTGAVIEMMLKANGFNVFVTRDLMSRVRGGHNFSLLRFGREPVVAHDNKVDLIMAMNQDTIDFHKEKLNESGLIIADEKFEADDSRAIMLAMTETAKDLGNPRVASSVAVGALIRLLDLPEEALREIFEKTLRAEHVDINMKAAKAGFEAVTLEQGEAARKKANSRAHGNGELIPESERKDY